MKKGIPPQREKILNWRRFKKTPFIPLMKDIAVDFPIV
jgi:hypothetical protein